MGGQPVSSPLQAYDDLRAMLKVQHLHPAMWNLDRIDQRGLPLDAEFRYSGDESTGTGAGATIYFGEGAWDAFLGGVHERTGRVRHNSCRCMRCAKRTCLGGS